MHLLISSLLGLPLAKRLRHGSVKFIKLNIGFVFVVQNQFLVAFQFTLIILNSVSIY